MSYFYVTCFWPMEREKGTKKVVMASWIGCITNNLRLVNGLHEIREEKIKDKASQTYENVSQ